MKVINKIILASFIFFTLGTGLYAEALLGLQNDSLIEVKPKACDFQWWTGSKNYNATSADQKAEDQNSVVKK